MELQQQLHAHDFKLCRRGKARTDNDRIKRLNSLIKASKTAPEALLKQCSIFNIKDSSGRALVVSEACDAIIVEREKQCNQLVQELKKVLRHAVWLNTQIGPPLKKGDGDVHFRSWKDTVASNAFGDRKGTNELMGLIDLAENGYKENHEEQFYRDPPTAEELAKEKEDHVRLTKAQAEAKIEANKNKKSAQKAKTVAKRDAKRVKENADKAKGIKPKPKLATDNSNFSEDIASECSDSSDSEDDEDKGRDLEYEQLATDADGQVNPTKDPYADIYVPPKDTRPVKLDRGNRTGLVQALRGLAGHLRGLSSEHVARIRALRFFRAVRCLQIWQFNLQSMNKGPSSPSAPICSGCTKAATVPSQFFVLGICGHYACQDCLEIEDRAGGCVAKIEDKCLAPAEDHHVHSAADLGVDEVVRSKYGSKLDAIINLIKKHIPKKDQVLLFVQFDDLMQQISRVLKAENIRHYALREKAGTGAAKKMQNFQANGGIGRKKVLLLNSSDVTAAGA